MLIMIRWSFILAISATATAVLPLAAPVSAETCTLELKRIEGGSQFVSGSNVENLFRLVHSQGFYTQFEREGRDDDHEKKFAKLIKKEPAKYECQTPYRGTAKLGSREFGFVLDSTNLKKKGYDRLYFDLNHNGDLTDDKVIKARQSNSWSSGSAQTEFPRTDVTIEVEGTPIQYAFSFSAHSQFESNYKYMSAHLSAAAYRTGEITVDGKKHQVALVDFNSNGRFDSEARVDPNTHYSSGGVYAETGDLLFFDPDPAASNPDYYDVTANDDRQYLGKLVNIAGRFYDLKVTPTGDKLTLTASTVPTGFVTNSNEQFRAMVYSDQGILKLNGTKDKPIVLPEGDWKLLSYTLDRTERKPEPAKPTVKKEEKKRSPLGRLLNKLAGSVGDFDEPPSSPPDRPRNTLIRASGTEEYKAVKVRKGQTVEFPFGPPYRAKVAVSTPLKGGVQLAMSLVGCAGEVCSDVTINGERPPAPTFCIATPKGEIVERGKFEFG